MTTLDIVKKYILLCQNDTSTDILLGYFSENCQIIDNKHTKIYVGKDQITQYYKSREKTWITPKIEDPNLNQDGSITIILIFKKLGMTVRTITLNVKFASNSELFEQITIN